VYFYYIIIENKEFVNKEKITRKSSSSGGSDVDPFGGTKLRPSGRCEKRRSGSTLSKPQHLYWGVDGLTYNPLSLIFNPTQRRALIIFSHKFFAKNSF